MKKYLIYPLTLAAVMLSACSGKEEKADSGKETTVPTVKIERVDSRTVDQLGTYTASVEAQIINNISSNTPNRIKQILVDEGQRVSAGQRVAVLDDVNTFGYETQVDNARANLKNVEVNYNRAVELFKIGGGTKQQVDAMEIQLVNAKNALAQAERTLRNARENMEIVKNGITQRYKELSNTQIRSTIDGMVLDVPIKVGNSVIQANTFNDGTTVATVADMTKMQFQGKIDETDVGKLHEGMPVKLTIGALQNVELDAELEYVAPKATEDNGVIMFEVKAAVRIPEDIFVRAGYSANASIMIQNREGVLALPESTVEFEGDKTYVYFLTSDPDADEQTFERREVAVGLSDGIDIEITEGLIEGDRIRGAKHDSKE